MTESATARSDFAEQLAGYLVARLQVPVVGLSLTSLSQGWESDIFRLDAPDWAAPRVLRLYFGAHAGPTALQEARAMRLLAQVGYPVPRVELVEPAAGALGRPFLLMDYVQGVSLGRRLRDPAHTDAAYDQFCTLLAQLHTLTWSHLPDAHHIPIITVDQQIAHWMAYTQRYPLATFDAMGEWLGKRAAAVQRQPAGLVHWDFHWENILVEENGTAWVIDWTQCQATDVRFDLGWTLALVGSMLGWDAAERVRRGYAQARGLLPETADVDMDFFEAAACGKRVVSVLISLQYGADALGMRPGAEANMRDALPSIAQVYRRWYELTAVPLPEAETLLAAHL